MDRKIARFEGGCRVRYGDCVGRWPVTGRHYPFSGNGIYREETLTGTRTSFSYRFPEPELVTRSHEVALALDAAIRG